MVLDAVVAGSIVAGAVPGARRRMRNEEQRRAEAEERREAKQQARDDRLCTAISAMGEKAGGLSAGVAGPEGELGSLGDLVRLVARSLAGPDRGGAGAACGGGRQ